MNNDVDIQRQQLKGAVEVANRVGLPLVATSDCHYCDREEAAVQDVMLCINTGSFRTDTKRMKMENNEFYLRSPEEMYSKFSGLEDACARSQEIADSVDIQLELGKRYFPVFQLPTGVNPDDRLTELCYQGLLERYAGNPEMCPDGKLAQVVIDRIERELGVIKKLGFANYFLICWDFVDQARKRDIPATARGSGVGALVCFALYLSHVCPIKYGLLFERFLDENRLEAPDIDIDFCKERRGDIIRYVKDKYGEESVAQIGTFGTLKARAAIKDVGRALGIPLARVNQVTAMVPEELNITLAEAIQKSEDLRAVYEGDPEIGELLDFAKQLEGMARNIGTHAAAVVIGEGPLTNYVPLGRVTGKTDIITQWSMKDVELAGLLKMDFLGLRTLTILRNTVDLIQQTTGQRIDILKFPLDDKAAFRILQSGETKGVFQLESGGIRDLLQKMKPDHFLDIVATNALYRPGPLEGGMVQQYIDVKHGRKAAEYKLPVLKDILGETNGVMVYQEQVMQILNRLGQIPLAAAYTCIKAISKKNEGLISKNYEQFMQGAVDQGLNKKDAQEMWDMILKFAGYGFNKCVVGGTEIADAVTGERTSVAELFKNRRDFNVHALGDDWKLRPRRVTDVVWNGVVQTYTVTTRTGRKLTATANHPLRTLNGWTTIAELKVGDQVASVRSERVEVTHPWKEHEVVTLGWLLSEGNLCHPAALYFYSNDREQLADFSRHVEQFPCTVARQSFRKNGRRGEVCVSTGRDMRFNAIDHAGVGTAVAAKRNVNVRSGAYQWAAALGIVGKTATEKSVPPAAFQLPAEQVAILLGRLWAGDGYVEKEAQQSYYATSSLKLAKDVQTLLNRLGIVSRVTEKIFQYRHRGILNPRVGFTVHLVGVESKALFFEQVGPQIVGKEQAAADALSRMSAHGYKTTGDLIPESVNRMVAQQRQRIGIAWRELEQHSGVCIRELCRTSPSKKRGFQRSTIRRISAFLESQELQDIANSDVYWDSILSIEPANVEDVYDLTVEHDHNFVANGIVVHNSHSTAYALVAYQTAYLKAHYPVEFMAALLSGDIPGRNFTSKDSLVEHMEDCERMQVKVVHPCINQSDVEFTVSNGQVHFALSAIKGCGAGAAEALATERKTNGPFKSLFDICQRVEVSRCGRSSLESLIKAGALDCLGARRSQLFAVLDKALQVGAAKHKDKLSGQKSLFDEDDESAIEEEVNIGLPEIPEMEEREKLSAEKEVLGFYLTSHPLAAYADRLTRYCSHKTSNLERLKDRDRVSMGGMLSSIKLSHVKNPKDSNSPTKYAMFDLEDVEGAIRCILWPQDFAKFGSMIISDEVVVLQGRLDFRGGDEANLIVDKVVPIDQLSESMSQGLKIRIDERELGREKLRVAQEVLRGYPGDRVLKIQLALVDGTVVELDSKRRIEVNEELCRRLRDALGEGNVETLIDEKGLSVKADPAPKWRRKE